MRLIVIAEDDAPVRRMMRVLLEHQGGVTVVEAADGHEAKLICTADIFVDLVIVDLEMPVMNGRELIEILAARKQSPKVLVCSGHKRIEGLHHLEKPFTPQAFRAAVEFALEGPTAAQQNRVTYAS